MQSVKLYLFIVVVGSMLGSCKKTECGVEPAELPVLVACAPATPVVRAVKDARGTVRFDQDLQQFIIRSHTPGTIDEVALGLPCGGVPASLLVEGQLVDFSGTYREFGPGPRPLPFGTKCFHLELQKIKAAE